MPEARDEPEGQNIRHMQVATIMRVISNAFRTIAFDVRSLKTDIGIDVGPTSLN